MCIYQCSRCCYNTFWSVDNQIVVWNKKNMETSWYLYPATIVISTFIVWYFDNSLSNLWHRCISTFFFLHNVDTLLVSLQNVFNGSHQILVTPLVFSHISVWNLRDCAIIGNNAPVKNTATVPNVLSSVTETANVACFRSCEVSPSNPVHLRCCRIRSIKKA